MRREEREFLMELICRVPDRLLAHRLRLAGKLSSMPGIPSSSMVKLHHGWSLLIDYGLRDEDWVSFKFLSPKGEVTQSLVTTKRDAENILKMLIDARFNERVGDSTNEELYFNLLSAV